MRTTWELSNYQVLQHSRLGPNTFIRVIYHFLHGLVESNKIIVSHVKTTDQLEDVFTKFLDYPKFKAIVDKTINFAS